MFLKNVNFHPKFYSLNDWNLATMWWLALVERERDCAWMIAFFLLPLFFFFFFFFTPQLMLFYYSGYCVIMFIEQFSYLSSYRPTKHYCSFCYFQSIGHSFAKPLAFIKRKFMIIINNWSYISLFYIGWNTLISYIWLLVLIVKEK